MTRSQFIHAVAISGNRIAASTDNVVVLQPEDASYGIVMETQQVGHTFKGKYVLTSLPENFDDLNLLAQQVFSDPDNSPVEFPCLTAQVKKQIINAVSLARDLTIMDKLWEPCI